MADETAPSTRRGLHEAIDGLVREAYENGVEAGDHSYSLRHNGPEIPDWEVLVTRVTDG